MMKRSDIWTRNAPPRSLVDAALGDVAFTPFWLDRPTAPDPSPPLAGATTCDLAVVGGGFTGLWTALLAKEQDPSRDVLVLEAARVGWAASGRNGGFAMATLTHGVRNGIARFPAELPELDRLGRANLRAIGDFVARHQIDCDWEPTGELLAAVEPWQIDDCREGAELLRASGYNASFIEGEELREDIKSPIYLGGYWDRDACVMVDPARLAWGLRRVCLEAGVRLAEGTPVLDLERDGRRVRLRTPAASVSAARVALGTNAFPSLLKRLRLSVVPIYDYALMTEPLDAERRAAIGWWQRQGVGDAGNQFHYYRLTRDDRILWGGYDAVYYFGSRIDAALESRPDIFAKLAGHFFTTFPQLEGVRFTHAWGGVVDTCLRVCAFYGTALGGRVAYSLGYTGMGVAESRFGAATMLELLAGHGTTADLRLVRSRPMQFPPEPLRYAAIEGTRRAYARADATGERGTWLRLLDRLGLGFDS
jgi:glycine/D-amino acid oxidase-like deaminating enzyme